MKKNDKIIAVIGVIILIIASIGIYIWVPEETKEQVANEDDLLSISSSFTTIPNAIAVSDSSPFYALIATPLAVHYTIDGVQEVIPLYVENISDPSEAIEKVKDQLVDPNEIIDNARSAKDCSLYIAEKYWEKSDAVLIIENNEAGYNLGVAAIPLASYLSIPVIVTDTLDLRVQEVLSNLGVKYSIICGDIQGYGKSFILHDIDEIIDASIDIVTERFGTVKYITLTNPRDAWPPEVLNETKFYFKGTIKGGNAFPSHLIASLLGKNKVVHSFTIPEDYKYALVKVDFRNLEDPKYCEEFGDDIVVMGNFVPYARTGASPALRDASGKIERDRFYTEKILYDMGGTEYNLFFQSNFFILKQADYELSITIEKLSDPYYPTMNQLSSIAPYLAAYHQGIVFAKPDFAFVADDDVLLDGKTLPGFTTVLQNPLLIPVLNRHVYENIHEPLNELIAKLAGVDLTKDNSLETLTKLCKSDPFYVALVGDATMLPQYYYKSPHNDPFTKQDSMYGTNCPSDFIYGNIDPKTYFMQPNDGKEETENDLYSPSAYPEVENIVGRITGWDVQDASALITRTIFYNGVLDNLGDWKDNAVVMSGAGLEFQKLPIFNTIYKLLGKEEPMKFPTGEQHFLDMRTASNLKDGGFTTKTAERGQAQRVGYSNEALNAIKKDGILNRLFFPKLLVKLTQGFESINSLFSPKWWSKALSDGSGIQGGELQENSNVILSNSHGIWFEVEHGDVMLGGVGGPIILYQALSRYIPIINFRTTLETIGSYNVREVSDMDMGPSVVFIEGCGSGKIDSISPTNTLANAYLHAGVNAYISPTTYSAIGGYLEPRPKFGGGVGLGIIGYLKAAVNARRGVYPPVHFCGVIFEKTYQNMIDKNVDIGTALRNAKNAFLPEEINKTYLWTPPLTYTMTDDAKTTARSGGGDRVVVEKYCTIYQLNLLGDPAFNPYEPCNEGK